VDNPSIAMLEYGVPVDLNPPAAYPISPLELLLPNGVAQTTRVIGSNCPARLLPKSTGSQTSVELLILAPTSRECRISGWLSQAVQSICRQPLKDSVVYVLAPPIWRAQIRRLLRRQGWTVGTPIAHIPDWRTSRYLVPLRAGPAQYAFNNLMPAPAWKKALLLPALRLPGLRKLIGDLLPFAGFAAVSPPGRLSFDWLGRDAGPECGPREMIVSTSSQRDRASFVVHCFFAGARPTVVAKVTGGERAPAGAQGEFAALVRFGEAARRTGAQTPQALALHQLGHRWVLYQSALAGRSGAALLTAYPGRLLPVMRQVAEWLARWNGATRMVQRLTQEQLEQDLLGPARELAPLLPQGQSYLTWLTARCAAIDAPIPLVTAHNDLTMWNLLFDSEGHLGVVDWAEARTGCLPLVDFFYAMTDAVLIARRCASRLEAFQACFVPTKPYDDAVRPLLAALIAAVDMPRDFVDVCLHACFLGHTANELHRNEPGEPKPFLEIARWLAINGDIMQSWMDS
jgi:hypothetical protein